MSDARARVEHVFAPGQAEVVLKLLDRIDELTSQLAAMELRDDWLTLKQAGACEGIGERAMAQRIARRPRRYRVRREGTRVYVSRRSLDGLIDSDGHQLT